jgi:CRP/FNR family transcriptional regulator, cyclic AMP receptor protein
MSAFIVKPAGTSPLPRSIDRLAPYLGPLFLGLQEEDLRAVASKAVIKTYAKNAIVISEGEMTGSLYVILSGKVKIYLGDESGKELILGMKGPGGYFGEMALDGEPRSASVMTLETSSFAVISNTDFKHLILEFPEISLHIIRNLAHIVRGLNKSVRSLAMLDVYGRLSRLLLDLAVEQGGKLVISQKPTQKDMANRVGSSREMINRIFRGLALGGYIKVEGKQITINKTLPARLQA